MAGFGKRPTLGERRIIARSAMLLDASMTTVTTHCGPIDLLDLSPTGARVAGPDLPVAGKDLLIKTAGAEVFGTVVWNRENECGIEFYQHLNGITLKNIALKNTQASVSEISPERRRTLDAWQSSLVR